MSIAFHPLTRSVGVEVLGVDLSRPLDTDFDPKERRALRRQQLVGDRLIAYRDTLRGGVRHASGHLST